MDDPQTRQPDITLARTRLGWEPQVSLEQGLESTIRYYREVSMQNPLKTLSYALDKYPEKVAMIPIQELLIESARKNDKRDAYVKLAVPDEVVKGLRGSRATRRISSCW